MLEKSLKIKNLFRKCQQLNYLQKCLQQSGGHLNAMKIFDRKMKTKQKDYFANCKNAETFDYLKEEMGFRLADKVFDIKRQFTMAVELTCGRGYVAPHLTNDVVETLILCDTSLSSLETTKTSNDDVHIMKVLADEETLPFKENSVDIFISSLSLHWINLLPQTFVSVMKCLKNDGVFLGSLFGGQTLYQLRSCLHLAETERLGGFSAHVSPLVETIDVGALLTRAGFTLLTIDTDEIIINYPSLFELMFDLQMMGESNVLLNRKPHLSRDVIFAAAAIYKEMYGNKENNSVPATFQILNFIGWKPDRSQPKPAERGSANFSLKDIANLDKLLDKSTVVNLDDDGDADKKLK